MGDFLSLKTEDDLSSIQEKGRYCEGWKKPWPANEIDGRKHWTDYKHLTSNIE